MPIIDFTQPFYLISALVLFLLCLYLSKNNKTNTVICITLLCFVTLLVSHTIELANADISQSQVSTLAVCIFVDEIFTLVSFLSFLWIDRIEIENKKKTKSSSKGNKEKVEDKVVEDGLDVLWKKV